MLDEIFEASRIDVARELGLDDTGVNGGGANATGAMTLVEFDREENVGGFRAAIGDEGIVRRAFETGIGEIDVGVAMSGGGEVDEAAAGSQQRCDAIHENKVTEMVGAELRFKSVGGFAEGRRHHARVGDDDVERLAFGDEFVGSGADAFEIAEVEFDELKAAAVGGGVFADLLGGGFRFLEVTGSADDVRAVSGERARGFDADTGRNAGDEDAFAFEIYAGENFVCG